MIWILYKNMLMLFSAVLLNFILGTIIYIIWKLLGRLAESKGYVEINYWIWKIVLLAFLCPVGIIVLFGIKKKGLYGFDFWYANKIRILLTVLGIVWFIGSVIRAFIYMKKMHQMHKMLQKGRKCQPEIIKKKQQICCELGQKNNIDIVKHKGIKIPMAYGIFHRRIVLPEIEYSTEEIDVNKRTIQEIVFPNTVNQIEAASFSKNMQSIASSAFLHSNQVKTFSCPKSNKTFAVKKGMLMTKSGKTLVLVPNKMKKITIPTSVKTIKAKAFNGSQATSIVIPKSVKKIEAKALSSKKVTKVSLSSKNKIYKMANNCIYRKSDGLLAGVIAKTKKVSIPSKVKVIDDTVSVMGKIGTKNQVHIPKSVNKVVERWMFYGDATVYFHGMKPPVIVSEYNGNEFTALPIFNKVYVPKKAKNTYIKWAKDRDGLTWHDLHTF